MPPPGASSPATGPPASTPPIQAAIRVEASAGAPLKGRVVARERVASTKWLALNSLTYTRPVDASSGSEEQKTRQWDSLSRTTRGSSSAADAVVVLALLRLEAGEGDDPRILLVKQYRPPVDAVVVELPAGLIDAGETPEQAALRELREETGFYGRVLSVGKPEALSPGAAEESVVVVTVDVTGRDPGGKRALEETEDIEVVSVPVARLREAVRFMEDEGCVAMHAVASLGLGVELALGTIGGSGNFRA